MSTSPSKHVHYQHMYSNNAPWITKQIYDKCEEYDEFVKNFYKANRKQRKKLAPRLSELTKERDILCENAEINWVKMNMNQNNITPSTDCGSINDDIHNFYIQTRVSDNQVKNRDRLFQYIQKRISILQTRCITEINSMHQKNITIKNKLKFLQNLKQSNTYLIPWNVFKFGSAPLGTNYTESDIDIAIDLNFKSNKYDKKYLLKQLYHMILQHNKILTGNLIKLHARYPVIQICAKQFHIRFDISIADNYCHKTQDYIAKCIKRFDDENIPIKKLIIFIKYWAKQHNINDSYHRYLNSFGYTLLVIKCLQICNPMNKSLSDLLFQFFWCYYVKFDVSKNSIVITNINNVFETKKDKNCLLEIVDPMNPTNNVGKNVGIVQWEHIKNAFGKSYDILSNNINYKKQSLFRLLTTKCEYENNKLFEKNVPKQNVPKQNVNGFVTPMQKFTADIDEYYANTRTTLQQIIEEGKLCKQINDSANDLQTRCEEEIKQIEKYKNLKKQFLCHMNNSKKYRDKWDIFVFGQKVSSVVLSWRDSDINVGILVNFRNVLSDKEYLLSELAKIIGHNDHAGLLLIKKIFNKDGYNTMIRITHNKLNIKADVIIADRFCKLRHLFISKMIRLFECKYEIQISKLIVIIKHWSKKKQINNLDSCFLNSFGYTILIIKFLQYHVNVDKHNYSKSLSYLVYKFFEFYHKQYIPQIHLISIHDHDDLNPKYVFSAKQFSKTINGYYLMHICDPVKPRNNIAKNVGLYELGRIKQEFEHAYNIIHNNKSNNNIFELLTQPSIFIQSHVNVKTLYENVFYDYHQLLLKYQNNIKNKVIDKYGANYLTNDGQFVRPTQIINSNKLIAKSLDSVSQSYYSYDSHPHFVNNSTDNCYMHMQSLNTFYGKSDTFNNVLPRTLMEFYDIKILPYKTWICAQIIGARLSCNTISDKIASTELYIEFDISDETGTCKGKTSSKLWKWICSKYDPIRNPQPGVDAFVNEWGKRYILIEMELKDPQKSLVFHAFQKGLL